ncbi:MAG: DUF4168 domain-containing protein [Synechococcales bacterium]|nr:DUF4168 domain-containing protein [Synechococcales bacterium]
MIQTLLNPSVRELPSDQLQPTQLQPVQPQPVQPQRSPLKQTPLKQTPLKQIPRKQTLLKTLGSLLTIGTLSSLAVITGITPELGRSNSSTQIAWAQESNFTRYVRAAFEIEKQRRSLMTQVKQLTEGQVPEEVCSSSGFNRLSPQFQGSVNSICRNFNEFAVKTICRYDLSMDEFNRFQRQARSSNAKERAEMQRRIDLEVDRLRLDRGGSSPNYPIDNCRR